MHVYHQLCLLVDLDLPVSEHTPEGGEVSQNLHSVDPDIYILFYSIRLSGLDRHEMKERLTLHVPVLPSS